MEAPERITSEVCLNCGSSTVENYCANCGQKAQATKQPLKVFLSDAVETLFNIDSRWFKTVRDLLFKPGYVTQQYIQGRRASYLPPLRIYLSISIVYFLFVQLIESNQIFFINFGMDDGSAGNLAEVIQYSLFFLVPVLALYIKLIYRKQQQYYVEGLILSFHIHSIWFVLLMFELFTVWLNDNYSQGWVEILAVIISFPAQLGTFLYVVFNLKKIYQQGWLKTVGKSFALMTLYILTLVAVVGVYAIIVLDILSW